MRRRRAAAAAALALLALVAAGAWGSGLFDAPHERGSGRPATSPEQAQVPATDAITPRRVPRRRAVTKSVTLTEPQLAPPEEPTEQPAEVPAVVCLIPIELRVIDAETGHAVLGAHASLQGNSKRELKRLTSDGAVLRGEIARSVAETRGVLGFFVGAPEGYVVEDRGRGGVMSPYAEKLVATAVVRPSLTVEIHVVDADGHPVAGANLWAVHVGSVDRLPRDHGLRTDLSGRVTAENIPFVRGESLVAWAETEDLFGSGVVQYPARPVRTVQLQVTMQARDSSTFGIGGSASSSFRSHCRSRAVVREPKRKASSIELLVLRHDGKPARRTAVSLTGVHTFALPPDAAADKAPDTFNFNASGQTDADGRVAFADLPSGSVRLTAKAVGLTTIRESLELGEAEESSLTLREMPGVQSSVRVVGVDGRPLPGARLTVTSEAASSAYVRIDHWGTQELGVVTDADGRARLANLPAGTATVEVRWASWSAKVELPAGDDLTIVLKR